MLRARALEQALRMLIDAAVQTACKIAEDGDRRWHVVDLVCATNDAEKLLAVDPPPSGASQFAIGEIVGIQGTLNVLLAEIDKLTAQPTCRVCGGYGFSAQKQTIDDGWGEVDTCPACSDQPAPVSPVEPTPEPETCEWRITSGPLGTWVKPTCVEGSIPAPWGTERAKACHLCGAPLKVER
jgi:hypothetical protein